MSKILNFSTAAAQFDSLRAHGKKIVQCHGTFDLVHPGHIHHLEEARSLGDVLVVTVTGEKFVNKGPGRPLFNDPMRARSLAALECVDYVIIVPHAAAVEAIECVKPHFYCKGTEYSDSNNDVTGNISDDVETVHRFGGEVHFMGSVVFSSTRLLNQHFDHLSTQTKDFCRDLASSYSPTAFRDQVEALADLRVLVIGDSIFDKYSYVRVQGLTSKASIVSAHHLYEELQLGGVLATYRHLKQFTSSVRLISILGNEDWAREEIQKNVDPADDRLIHSPDYQSITKHRFVSPLQEGKELTKHFSVNFLDNNPPEESVIDAVMQKLEAEVARADVVLVMDFGHGLMQPRVRDFLQDKATFLALNCQTNSNNHGFNILNRQYRRADCFSLDEAEIHLAHGSRQIHYPLSLETLRESLDAEYAWLTRGSIETIGLRRGEPQVMCFPWETEVIDTIGAGDAFISVAALAAGKRYDNRLCTFLGQLAGSQAVQIVGNTRPISKPTLLKAGMSLLNF